MTTKNIDGRRYYLTPEGIHLPSVTTVLGHFEKEKINKWRQKVGEKEANRVSKLATSRGKSFHALVEDYVQNKPVDLSEVTPDTKVNFIHFKPTLCRIDNISHIEAPLYSLKLGVAGRTDLIAEFDGITSIIDHKTSKKIKKREWIQHYFEQETAYAIMYYHMTGIIINQLVILMSVDYQPEASVFTSKTEDHILPLKAKIKTYKEYQSNVS